MRSTRISRPAVRLLAALAAATLRACGPWFPTTVLDKPDAVLREAPVAMFADELHRLGATARTGLAVIPPPTNSDVYGQSIAVDLADLRAALNAAGMRAARRDRCLDAFLAARNTLRARAQAGGNRLLPAITNALSPPAVPADLPPEFAGYLRGLIAFRFGRTNEAREAWLSVLALPEPERRQRTLWAAYMLGRSWIAESPAQAVAWFRDARRFHDAGLPDTLGLTAASLGWEAQAEWRRGSFTCAIDLYLEQLATGDDGAVASLRRVAGAAVAAGPELLSTLATHDPEQRVITAWCLSQDEPAEQAGSWLAAVEAAHGRDVTGADRLAWLAYQAGDADRASRWLRVARSDAPIAQWVRAKLLLRAGKTDAAAEVLAGLVQAFPRAGDWSDSYKPSEVIAGGLTHHPPHAVAGELAILRMGRGQYAGALDLLARHAYWQDAAYVAERVLTTAELRRYVDASWPMGAWNPQAEGYSLWPSDEIPETFDAATIGGLLRWLLARRLARAGQNAEARAYYPPSLLASFDTYTTGLARGRDRTAPAAARASALMAAARVARAQGMELLGTECEPDWRCVDGAYELGTAERGRFADVRASALVQADERRRVHRTPPASPDLRFHYRYQAADLAWEAIRLMPDQSADTARALCEAGGWLGGRDPKAADRFYQALVTRCSRTDPGRAAAAAHWFPRLAAEVHRDAP